MSRTGRAGGNRAVDDCSVMFAHAVRPATGAL